MRFTEMRSGEERGAVLVITLITMVVLLVLGTALASSSMADMVRTVRQDNKTAAYYLARSGAVAVASYLIDNPQELKDLNGETDTGYLDGREFEVTVTDEGEEVEIKSTGFSGNFSETVILTLVPGWQWPILDMAVFSLTGIKLADNSKIERCGTNSVAEHSVTFEPNTCVNGDLYVGPEGDPNKVIRFFWSNPKKHVSGNIGCLDEPRVYPLPPFPNFPELPEKDDLIVSGASSEEWISEDGFYHKLIVKDANNRLYIDVPDDGIRRIRVGRFEVTGAGSKVVLRGKGTLYLYIDEKFILGGNAQINYGGDPNKIMLLYNGTDQIGGADNSEFYGCLFAKTADVKWKGNGGIMGSIITGGNVTLEDNSTTIVRTIYAPNGSVHITGNSEIYGTLIGNSFLANGNSKVFYRQTSPEETPLPDADSRCLSLGLWKHN